MNRLSPVSMISEASVNGPYRPTRTPMNNVTPFRQQWKNTDYPLAPKQLPPQNRVPVVVSQPAKPPVTVAAQPQDKRTFWHKATALAGVAMCSLGVVAGLVSIVALGPIGLAVAAGAAVVGIGLMGLSSKN